MSKMFCPRCGTENEDKYLYCKNCGTPLGEYEQQKNSGGNNAPGSVGSETPYSIDGIKSEEICCFIGKNSAAISNKFFKMHLLDSKVSWCWPAAILGFLFGPIGSAIWFFYRKMYKAAFAVSGIGLLFAIAFRIISPGAIISDYTANDIINMITGNGLAVLGDIINYKTALLGMAEDLVNIAAGVLSGIFSMSLYERFVIKKIKRFKASENDKRLYNIGLSMLGGTSSGMAVLGVFILLFVDNIGSIGNYINL